MTAADDIRLIVSDFGNVICSFDYRIFCERLARRIDRTAEEVFSRLFTGDLEVRFESGALSSPEYHREVMRMFSADVPYDEFFTMFGDIFTEIRATCEL